MNPEDEDEHFDDLEYEDDEEDPWDLHDYEGESPESLQSWYNGRVL